MSRVRVGSPDGRLVDPPADIRSSTRFPADPVALAPRDRRAAEMAGRSVAFLQRSAGNRAVAQQLAVQRCGSIPADRCPCHGSESPEQVAAPAAPVQRDDDPLTSGGPPGAASEPAGQTSRQGGTLAELKPLVDDAIAAVGPGATTVLPVPVEAPADASLQAQRQASVQRHSDPVVQRDGGASTAYHPEGGLIASVQLCYDFMTGAIELVGWLWAGAGYKTPFGWYGAYTFVEGSWTIGNVGALITPGVCAGRDQAEHGRVGIHGGSGFALFPVVILPGQRVHFAQAGFELGVLFTPHPSDWSADLEVIGLVDVKKYLGPFGAIAAAAEAAAQRIGAEFGQRVECGAGFDLSLSAHLCRAADPASGILGYTASSLKLCGGGFVGCAINLSRTRSALPGGGH
jgi:hypothetical protein